MVGEEICNVRHRMGASCAGASGTENYVDRPLILPVQNSDSTSAQEHAQQLLLVARETPSGPEPACVATALYCSIHLLLDFVLPKATDLRRALDERAARFPDAWLVSSSVALASHPSTTLPRPGRLAASQRGAPCAFAEGLDAS